MAKQQPIELFMPPNMLKAKVGGTISGLDMAAVRRAEAAMETLKSGFGEWLAADVQRLVECRDRFAAKPDRETAEDLFRAGHDIKGQSGTFEYPLVARVASSLCQLIDATHVTDSIPLLLVDAHVTAIRIIFRDKIRDLSNRMALELVEELEARVIEATEPTDHAA